MVPKIDIITKKKHKYKLAYILLLLITIQSVTYVQRDIARSQIRMYNVGKCIMLVQALNMEKSLTATRGTMQS